MGVLQLGTGEGYLGGTGDYYGGGVVEVTMYQVTTDHFYPWKPLFLTTCSTAYIVVRLVLLVIVVW